MHDPSAINIAEYWGPEPAVVRPHSEGGAGFHATWHDGLRRAIRGVIAQASGGRNARVDWQPVVDQLRAPGFPRCLARRAIRREPRRGLPRPRPAHPGARGRRQATRGHGTPRAARASPPALLLTAPGIPMLFMGQEFYEDKRWDDDPPNHPGTLIYWDGLDHDKTMSDFHRFTRELVWLRRKHPALRGERVRTLSMENEPRVLVFQRWVEGVGRDVIVVASLNESTLSRLPDPDAVIRHLARSVQQRRVRELGQPSRVGQRRQHTRGRSALERAPAFRLRNDPGQLRAGLRAGLRDGSSFMPASSAPDVGSRFPGNLKAAIQHPLGVGGWELVLT